MIDQLESRRLFSITPAHAALNVLRADVASVGNTINVMISEDKSAIANLQHDTSIFPATYLTTDHLTLQSLSDQFRVDVAILANDFNNVKVLLGQDITQLINDTNAYNRHPTAAIGQVVDSTEQLLVAQGNAAVAGLGQDANNLVNDYVAWLSTLAAAHPIDAILDTRASNIATEMSNNAAAIQSSAGTVADNDIPNFFDALEPDGVVTPDVL
jgi:hypothetical protein